jgi:hypothetical protein
MKSRPFGVTVLAILAGLAAISAAFTALQMLGLFRTSFSVEFFGISILGAIMWGLLAAIYIWLVKMLWDVDPRGWLFLVLLSAINLIMAVVSILGRSTWQAMLPSLILNGLVLIYCLLPGTKQAFGTE